MGRYLSGLAAAALISAFAANATAQQSPPPNIDEFVAGVMAEYEVPGIGLAIVKDGEVVLAKGYGVRQLGDSTPVDAQTLFGIASNTKAFTATALALLVEEGKLQWDTPVIDCLPWFRMSDPYVTRELTIRDLLVHRSGLGLGAGDLLWWPPSTYNRKEIAHRLRYVPLATTFRSTYAYDNVLYLVAGEIIEQVSGQTWEDFVASRILTHVGMTHSNVRHSDAASGGNVATTHARIGGTVRPIKPFTSDNTNPAGGINSNAEDMAKWLIVQLDSGRIAADDRLFSPRTTQELWRIVTPIASGSTAPELAVLRPQFSGYALGFRVRDYRGEKLVTHTGGLPGYVSLVLMLPSYRLGVAVLTNMESGAAFNIIGMHILDYYLGASDIDWFAAYKTVITRTDSMLLAQDRYRAVRRDSLSRPSLPLEKYADTYTDQWYGDVTIRHEDDNLGIQFSHTPSLVGDLEHWQYDTFVARWHDRELRADAFVTFVLGPEGEIQEVRMRPASPSVDFSFDFQDLLLKPKHER